MAEDIVKSCPACRDAGEGPDIPMVERANKTTAGHFLGCSRWPDCKYTEPIPENIRMRRMGAATLPGFD